MSTNGQFYVYVQQDPRDGSIFYVGKGSGGRWNQKDKSARNDYYNSKVAKIKKEGMEPLSEIIYRDDDEEAVLELEELLIQEIGRKKEGGPLCNLSAGGKGNSTFRFGQDFFDKLGKVDDKTLGDEYGCTEGLVWYYRNAEGIPYKPSPKKTACMPPSNKGVYKVHLPQECIDKIGKVSDRVLAKEYGVGRRIIVSRRKALGLESYRDNFGVYGGSAGNTDHSVYKFEHKETGEVFVGKRVDFAEYTGKRPQLLNNLVWGKSKTAYGWRLINE